MPRPLEQLVDPTWIAALDSQRENLRRIGQFLSDENSAGRPWLPAGEHILRAFTQPMTSVRVVIIGQDPYPTPGHAVGLSFSVAPGIAPPRSLVNIYKELHTDLGCPRPTTGDLTPWSDQGVLLLNRVLTVSAGESGSHRRQGWEEFTECAVSALARMQPNPPVFILWGKDAHQVSTLIGDSPCIQSAHPSPMSADRGFFGSRPFSRANAILEQRGQQPIQWCLD